MKVGFLISGDLGETVLIYFIDKIDIEFVLTDKKSKSIIELCQKSKVQVYAGNPRNEKINKFIAGLTCDVIVSVNYLFLINKKIIDLAKILCFNIHGSLLPKYRGRTPHVWSIINGETQTGVTAHIIDEGCDSGPIIKQVIVDINSEDTGATILDKYKIIYVPLIEEVFEKIRANKIEVTIQDENKASYYGKRTPEDGQINWNWSFEKIINWVRAQSYPYPGAFTFYNNTKVIIDRVSKSDFNYYNSLENGTIISINPLLVKCEGAILRIESVRNSDSIFRINEKFDFI
jgi:methionyl-tRNA formyltransferase